jgi:hypothetical protein
VAPEKAPAKPGGGSEDKTYLINVARTAESDEPFQIGMVFETPLREKELGITDLLRLPLPQFDEGVKFQQVCVRVWTPKDYRLVGDPEQFTSHIGVGLWDSRKITDAPENPDSWFPKDASSFDFQVGGTTYLFSSLTSPTELKIDYWHIPTMTLIASLLVLVIGVALTACSLEAKVFTILGAVFLVLFAGLFSPSVVNSWLLAARLGIAGVVALWTVIWLMHVRRTVEASPSSARRDVAAPIPTAGGSSGSATGSPLAPKTAETESPNGATASDDGPVAGESEDAAGEPRRGGDDQ